MSDVGDWTGVSAGATQLLTSGIVVTAGGGGVFTADIPVASVPQTTRSLLLLLNWDAGNSGNTQILGVTVQGSTSKLKWTSGAAPVLADSGAVTVVLGEATMPVYVPFYGVVDGAGDITLKDNTGGTWHYWVLALPDADLLGSAANPVSVINSPYPALVTAAKAAVGVEIETTGLGGSSSPLFVQTANPAHGLDASASVTQTGAIVTNQTFLAAPAAGKQRVIDYVYSSASGTVFFGLNGANPAPAPVAIPNGSAVTPRWRLTGTLQYTIQGAAGGNIYVAYHDEAI